MPLRYYFSMAPCQIRLCMENEIYVDTLISFIWLTNKVAKARGADAHDIIKQGRDKGKVFMLDSGGFTNFQKPGTVKIEQYCEYLKSHKDIWSEYVTFDDLASRDNTIKQHEQLLKGGFKPLFVDHIRLKDDARLLKYWKRDPKLCLSSWGTVVNTTGPQVEVQENVKQQLARRVELGRKVKTKVHLLAVSSLAKFMPFLDVVDSVDSATWGRQPGYGRLIYAYQKDIGGTKLPFLTTFDHPGVLVKKRPMPPEVKSQFEAFKNSRKWKVGCDRRVIEFFCIKQIQAYISKINELGPETIRNAIVNHKAEKAEHVSRAMVDLSNVEEWDGGDGDRDAVLMLEGEVHGALARIDEELEKKQTTDLQTVICSKERFDTLDAAKKWVKDHNFKVDHKGKGPDETSSSYRFRQRDPGDFQRGSFRTIELTDGVKAVVGKLKKIDKAVWTRAFINDLPDSAFLYIAPGGKKDEDGKTVPRSLRYFPVKDKQGELDLPHLRNALARIPQSKLPAEAKAKAAAKAKKLLEEAKKAASKVCSGACTSQEVDEAYIRLLPVEKADADRRIVFGVVLEPNSVDSQGDTITAAEIEQAAHLWLARFQDRGLMHRRIVNSKIEIYESYIAPTNLTIGGQKVKKGTWLLMYHVLDDELWKQIKSGKLAGFSMGGFARRKPLAA